MWYSPFGPIIVTKHRLELLNESTQPGHSVLYRAGPETRNFKKSETKKMLPQNRIKPAQNKWAAPILFAPKSDGTLRFGVDYRKLNAVSKVDFYAKSRMDECNDFWGKPTVFPRLHTNCGCLQPTMEKPDCDETGFTVHHEVYRFICMPYGQRDGFVSFQLKIDVTLSAIKLQFALVYMDSVATFPRSQTKHIAIVRKVIMLLNSEGVTTKFKKYRFINGN